MSSNLPPGCTSDDGGIDHDLELAHEILCDMVDSVELAKALIRLIPNIQSIMNDSFKAGADEKLVNNSMQCQHVFQYFGDQKKRRCIYCDKIENSEGN